MPTRPVVIWADPGLMTGWASYDVQRDHFMSGQERFREFGAMLAYTVEFLNRHVVIGWEHYSPDSPKKSTPAPPLEVIGMIKWIGRDCILAPSTMPADRKVASPAVLKRLGWWAPGREHANAAAQHLLLWHIGCGTLTPAMDAAFRAQLTARKES